MSIQRSSLFPSIIIATSVAFTSCGINDLSGEGQLSRSTQPILKLTEAHAVDVEHLFVPRGFDDNDNSQIVMDGWLNSTCDESVKPEYRVHAPSRTIEVAAIAERVSGICLPVLRRFTAIVDIGTLPAGTYRIVTNNYQLVREMVVEEAPSAGRDDHVYAQVDEVSIGFQTNEAGALTFELKGKIPQSCLQWQDLQIDDSGETIEIRPILQEDGSECVASSEEFVKTGVLPSRSSDGRYLLHVRSYDGHAVNKVFTPAELGL
jgi:hypothetical protein